MINKIRLILSLLILTHCILADNIDYSNWLVRIETKEINSETSSYKIQSLAKSLIRTMFYDSKRTVEDYLNENRNIARQFDRLQLKINETDVKFLSDGSVIIQYELPISGNLIDLLIPDLKEPTLVSELACPICKRVWPENQEVPPDVKLIPLEQEPNIIYTAIIIDARDIFLRPALFPKIISEDNHEIYTVNFTDQQALRNHGLITYLKSINDAFDEKLVGTNPLRISAIQSSGDNKTDIIISRATAKTIHSSQNNLKLLKQCKVFVILNE